MKPINKNILMLSIVVALAKGISVFYFIMLPIFYAEGVISTKALGYLGALAIAMVIFGAVIVARWLHSLSTKKLLMLSAWTLIFSTIILFLGLEFKNILLLSVSYAVMGVASGTALSGINVLIAHNTVTGDRFKAMAQLTMLTDVVRIVFPLLAAIAVGIGESIMAIALILLAALAFLILTSRESEFNKLKDDDADEVSVKKLEKVVHNKSFRFILSLEFLDSFSSSQLFVFLPLLFLAKGYTIQNTLVLQSAIFIGYLSGRWVISLLAKRYSGLKAVAIAEVGMVLVIVFMLFAKSIGLLYVLTFLLGIFARGTSPAIKALAFDALPSHQVKQGSAFHVIAGDSGSALAQLLFGLLVAWYGINAPFIVATVVALYIAFVAALKLLRGLGSNITP